MSGSGHERNCDCLECRVREALRADGVAAPEDGVVPVDAREALEALCRVSAELLAHHSSDEAKAFFLKLLDYRKRWQKLPHVMVQREPQGRA
jgi:hypothetical protein